MLFFIEEQKKYDLVFIIYVYIQREKKREEETTIKVYKD